jgi:adenosylhomocysteine nucleosidase
MVLRWIVNRYLHEAAEQKLRQLAAGAPAHVESPQAGASRGKSPSGVAAERDDFLPCEIAFVFALGIESGGLVDCLKDAETSRHKHGIERAGELDGREVVIVESGLGGQVAARAVRAAIEFYRPRWIVSAGFAGALCPDLRRGQLLMPDRVTSEQGAELDVGIELSQEVVAGSHGLHVGKLLTVDHLVRRASIRRSLHEQHAALACDMETFAVAEACREASARMLAVRIISDEVDDELPPEIEHLLSQKTLVGKFGAATGALMKRLGAAKDLWNLREEAIKNSDRLARFLRGVIAQLP